MKGIKESEKIFPEDNFSFQLLTYLRLMNLRLGFVINFGERYVKNGIHRVVNLY